MLEEENGEDEVEKRGIWVGEEEVVGDVKNVSSPFGISRR
jgi:hypothetical protein